MKALVIYAVAVLLSVGSALAQEGQTATLPSVEVKNVAGSLINTADFGKTGKPVIISFWATWCKPCIQELQTYHALYPDWQEKYGASLVAVSIDDTRNASKVAPFIKSRNWTYEVLLDVNQEFKRAMNVNNVPHTFVVMNGKVVFSHSAYSSGDEDELEELLKKLTGK